MTAASGLSSPGGALPGVLVLAGGPDAEHEISLQSAEAVACALFQAGAEVHRVVIERPTLDELRAMSGEVVFPVLHGSYGEGGPLQDVLGSLGRPFVGCCARAARTAMDKLATKLIAARLGIGTKPACLFQTLDNACALDLPVVVKPVHEGSSVGLHVCRDARAWAAAHDAVCRDIVEHPERVYMVEAMVTGREVTVGLLEGQEGFVALPMIEIVPRSGVYDYQAKYDRDDTAYVVNPDIAPSLLAHCQQAAVSLAEAFGVRHLCRVDFLIDEANTPWFLEVNTMPGFTSHSLFPMAAAAAGFEMPHLCAHVVQMAAGRLQEN